MQLLDARDLSPPKGKFRIIRVYLDKDLSLCEEVVSDHNSLALAKLFAHTVADHYFYLIYDDSRGHPVWETPDGNNKLFSRMYGLD